MTIHSKPDLFTLLHEWLSIDDWTDDTIAPRDLVERTQAAIAENDRRASV